MLATRPFPERKPCSRKTVRRLAFWSLAISLTVFAIKQIPDRYQMATTAYREGNFPEAVSLWNKMASLGDIEAQYNLGVLFATGKGVGLSRPEAFNWFMKAAEQGHPAAQFEVGKLYEIGLGVDVNHDLADMWIRESAEQGYQPAQIKMGLKYLNGEGVERNREEATYWFERVAGDDHTPPVLFSASSGTTGAPPCDDGST